MPGVVVLFDDAVAARWMPFALTRPAGELLFGAFPVHARAGLVLGIPCAGHIAGPGLETFGEPEGLPVCAPDGFDANRPRLFLSSRVVLDWHATFTPPDHPALVRVSGEAAGWYAPAGSPAPPHAFFAAPGNGVAEAAWEIDLPGRVLAHVWDLMILNSAQITADWPGLKRSRAAEPVLDVAGFDIVGGDHTLLRIEASDSVIEPHVVFDVSNGPILIAPRVTIRAFTRIAGPAFIGEGSTVLGGSLSRVSIGPVCKVRGEVEASVLLGFDNKAHDGFLGHAYLGRWVNLGALTTNSDLKNNWGPVRVWTPDGELDTGSSKVGCFIGDHAKTAIGTMIGTGTVIGAGANVFGGSPARVVPPFSWGVAGDVPWALDRFLETAAIAMGRRGVALSAGIRQVLSRAWKETRATATATQE
ncbi:MAG: hypothetical protein L0271_15725 [Gemmatimonadetes bacterium]|nr:hypothetical protein [Gemmatimonadota bacterium]